MTDAVVTDHCAGRLSHLDLQMIRSVPQGGNWRDIPESILSRRLAQIREHAAKGEGSRSTYYGRLRWDAPAYTISTYFNRPGNGCFIHPAADRLITIREAARLQSFPDAYQFHGSIRQRQTQVGNAVPPLVAYQLAGALPVGTYVDLFCGAGGLSLGLDWAGFRCVAAVDQDQASLETFSRNRTGDEVTIRADLGAEGGYSDVLRAIRARLGHQQLDLLVGGPPCQGFSTAGKNIRGDPRNALMACFTRFIEDLAPRSVLIENVPALAWRRSRHVLARVREELHAHGYTHDVIVAHAEGYGVPQLRRRLFVLAVRGTDAIRWPVATHQILRPAYLEYQPSLDAGTGFTPKVPYTTEDAIADLPVPTARQPTEGVRYARPAQSDYARWVRGIAPVEELVSRAPLVAGRSTGCGDWVSP